MTTDTAREGADLRAALKLGLEQWLPIDPDLADDAAGWLARSVVGPRLATLTADLDAMRAARDEARDLITHYEAAQADKRWLAREIDVAMHGEAGAALQPSLCDLVGPARKLRARADAAEADRAVLRERVAAVEAALRALHMAVQAGCPHGSPALDAALAAALALLAQQGATDD